VNKTVLAALAACALLSACGTSTPADPDAVAKAGGAKPRVVVAVIDSAMNPYHEYFYAGSPIYPNGGPSSVTPEVLAALGVPPENVIELSHTGNLTKDKFTDAAKWAAVQPRKPYWFKGTNLIGISFADAPCLVPSANPAKSPHGVGTSASVLTANPDAIVLFVETWSELATDDSHLYAFLHPAVDVISTSYGVGLPVDPVGTGLFLPEVEPFVASFDGVVRLGKMHFSSGGNSPGFTPARGGAGPWWSIGVDGSEEGTSEGRELLSGNVPDFVADFTQELPYCQDCERGTQSVSGTSFSTPRAAGFASKIILEARRALGHVGGIRVAADGTPIMAEGPGRALTNWQIRRAMEEGAWVATPADFDVAALDTAVPVNDAAPWLQVGWGELSTVPEKQVVTETLAHLGFGTPTRTKSAEFCDYQTKVIEERIFWWQNLALDAAERAIETVPYVFCGSSLPAL
jgi:hypothetical protein